MGRKRHSEGVEKGGWGGERARGREKRGGRRSKGRGECRRSEPEALKFDPSKNVHFKGGRSSGKQGRDRETTPMFCL